MGQEENKKEGVREPEYKDGMNVTFEIRDLKGNEIKTEEGDLLPVILTFKYEDQERCFSLGAYNLFQTIRKGNPRLDLEDFVFKSLN